MMKNIVGKKFGRIEVLAYHSYASKSHRFLCRCDCGIEKVVIGQSLTSGKTTSCGCYQREAARKAKTTHGHSPRNRPKDITYNSWRNMISRCHNKNTKSYKDYGGRGIVVCDEWKDDFLAFLSHVGHRPSAAHSIGRIDNNLGYVPGNVRWETTKEQNRNSRHNVTFMVDGAPMTIKELSESCGIKFSTLYARLMVYHWPLDLAVSVQPKSGQKILRYYE